MQAVRKNGLINDMISKFGQQQSDAPSMSMQGNGDRQLQDGSSVPSLGPTPQAAGKLQTAQQSNPLSFVPADAIRSDLAFNDGKELSKFMFETGKRDMQVHNGYIYDKNRVGSGFLPGMSTSADGKTSMTTIGPDGNPVISAPQGAVDTFSRYQSAGKQAENENTLAGLDRIDPRTMRPYVATVGQLVREAQGGVPQGFNSLPPQLRAGIQQGANSNGAPVNVNMNMGGGQSVTGPVSPSGFSGYAGAGDLKAQSDAQALEQARKIEDLNIEKKPMLEYGNKRAAAADETEKKIGLEAKTATDFTKRIQDMRDVLTFDPNSATPRRKYFAEIAQSFGAPDSMVKGIAGGNLADIQQFQKMAITNSMEALKSDMDSGRITQAEFQIYKENSPNIGLLKSATEGIFNRAQERNALALRKQQEFATYKADSLKSGKVPDGFDSQFNDGLVKSGAVNPQVTSRPGTNQATNKSAIKGQIMDGYRFKGGNPADPTAWEKI